MTGAYNGLNILKYFEEKITTKAHKAHKEEKMRLYTKTFFAADQRSDGAFAVKILPIWVFLRYLKVNADALKADC
jgi:hypothetical protein